MKVYNPAFIVLFFSLNIASASIVKEINIVGNYYTKEHVIMREIYHPVPCEYDSTLSIKDKDRIYNLGLFSTVEIY